MNAKGAVVLSGGLALAGSFKKASGFPPNGYAVVGGTVALMFIVSLTDGTIVEGPVKAACMLMLLVAAIRYIPGLANTKKKG